MSVKDDLKLAGHVVTLPSGYAGDASTMDLREFIAALRRVRRTILLWTAIPVLLTLAYCVLATPLYTSLTSILIDPREKQIVSNDLTPGGVAADSGVAVVESQLRVVSSDNVLRRAIAATGLATDAEFGAEPDSLLGQLKNQLANLIGLGDQDAGDADPELKALRVLKRRVTAKRSDKAFVVDVFVTTDDRDKSVRVADAIAAAYLDELAQARAAAARQSSSALTARLNSLSERVRESENRVVQYKKEHNIVDAGGVLVNEQQLKEVNTQLDVVRARRDDARARFEQVQRALQAGGEPELIPEALQSPTVAQLRAQYAQAIRRRASLGSHLGPRHPDVSRLDEAVRVLQRLINEELQRIAVSARSEYERSQASVASLERRLEDSKREAMSTNQSFVALRELTRELDANRGVYEAFLLRARETGEQSTIDNTNVRIISSATPAKSASWPPRLLLLAGSIVLGLGLGTSVALARDHLDGTIKSARELRDMTGLPTLASVRSTSAREARRAIGGLLKRDDERGLERLLAKHDMAFRRVVVALSKGAQSRSLLVTSPTTGDERLVLAIALARAFAAQGGRVLLVDADERQGVLSRLFATDGELGLREVLAGGASLADAVIEDSEKRLSFLPRGNLQPRDLSQFKPEVVAQRLTAAASGFDWVIVDAGAVVGDTSVRSSPTRWTTSYLPCGQRARSGASFHWRSKP